MAVSFYDSPATLLDDIDNFEQQIKDFRAGNIHATSFKGMRVAFGVYEQRKRDTYMVRIRCSVGGITPKQLQRAAELGEQYGNGHVHVTTRQEIQLHYVKLEDVPTVQRELHKVGLSTRGGGGNTIRNIMASYNSGISKDEVFDVEPYVVALTTKLIKEDDSWNLPRKMKLTFSSSADDNANATLQDLGFIAKIQDGVKGFEVWTAGGMGITPYVGKKLEDFVAAEDLYKCVKAMKNMFHKHGDRRNKNKNRLRFLWNDLTGEKYTQYYRDEFKALGNGEELNLDIKPRENSANLEGWQPSRLLATEVPKFEKWKERFVEEQKQEGLYQVKVSLVLGDIYTKDALALAKLLNPIGDNVIRCSMDQNIYLRNIPEEFLSKLFITLKNMTNFYSKPKLYSNMIACTGADTCKLGICLPRGLTPEIQREMDSIDPEILDNLHDLKVNISGCPNSCGQHHVGDLGFFGRIKKNKEGRSFPAYNIIGGAIVKPGETRFGLDAGWVHSRDLPKAIVDIMVAYEESRDNYTDFAEYFEVEGRDTIAEIADNYNNRIPSFKDDKNYYFDWGAEDVFSTEGMGSGECSAGIFDMIAVDQKLIERNINVLRDEEDQEKRDQLLYKIILPTARMLLVTRGVDARSEKEVYEKFIEHFVDKKLIDSKYLVTIKNAINHHLLAEVDVLGLSEDVIKLYGTMDRSMKFPGEEVSMAIDTSVGGTNKTSIKADEKKESGRRFKDLRGVACPMNFVKTKMELSQIDSGDELEILLDDGQPIENVPGSVRGEGHDVLSQEKIDDHWKVVIKKV